MSRAKVEYVCQECGQRSIRWQGRCPACGEWNTMVEEVPAPASGGARGSSGLSRHRSWTGTSGGPGLSASPGPTPMDRLEPETAPRLSTGFGELDRVLGGGLVGGSLVLLAGDPGVGKSTLLLQVAAHVARHFGPVLYVSGEESIHQVALRGRRLTPPGRAGLPRRPRPGEGGGGSADGSPAPGGPGRGGSAGHDVPPAPPAAGAPAEPGTPLLLGETDILLIEKYLAETAPALAIIDSIQTTFHPQLASAPGTVAQVRECAAHLLRAAKTTGTVIVLVGHVTKSGDIAGPRTLEHLTDVVLQFEGERHYAYRMIRGLKNRYGSTNELGLFEMGGSGLKEVVNPSAVFLAERPEDTAGSVVMAGMEGTRPLLVEIQALVSPSPFPHPRRTAAGVAAGRIDLLLAVLEKRAHLAMAGLDVYVKVSGGIRIDEPAADLGIALALASSALNRPARPDVAVFGEVGLGGEIRSVSQAPQRIREAARLGFRQCIVPAGSAADPGPPGRKLTGGGPVSAERGSAPPAETGTMDTEGNSAAPGGMEIVPVQTLREAMDAALMPS